MKIALLSDIHANLEAFEAVMRRIGEANVDRVVSLGDVVGYGPDPDACVDRIGTIADIRLCGNHDQAALAETDPADFNEDARNAILWTRRVIAGQTAEKLKSYAMLCVEEAWMAVHATPEAPARWEYLMTGADIRRNLEIIPAPVCFVGHSHYPGIFERTKTGEILEHRTTEIRLAEGSRYLINVGSVGQPRDGDPRSAFGLLDTDAGVFRLLRTEYPILPVQQRMAAAGLPPNLIDRLAMGF